ncbi:phage baseplate assembly protein [Fibrobacter sp. UWR1]|uniref:phage baseplate assembly protein n=1 Tax=Fibrobacter sp. UWR1 TaxID=2135645 RepID=UPI000DAB92E1|nr:phage baseplate assembly protein [Fibrobacter sp. UWR1]PZW73505.1 bacteriophage Mu Gp45 protein [Fibrobacter sp. UWR1]
MMKFFTSIVESCKDVAGKLRNLTAKANDIEFEDRQLMQQFGFISIPRKGDRMLLLQFGNVVIAVASDSADRPAVNEGETALYREKEHYIILKDDGTIAIKASGGVDIDGDLRVTGDVQDKSGTLDRLRQNYNKHTHVGNLGAPTSPTTDAQDM